MTDQPRIPQKSNLLARSLGVLALFQAGVSPAFGQQEPAQNSALTYVDLVELGQASDLVLQVLVDDQIVVPIERAPGLGAGQARLYIESITQALLAGSGPVGESLTFLVDQPLDTDGDEPDLEEGSFLLFARRVAGRPGEIQLVGPTAMQAADPVLEQRVRRVLTQLVQGERPPAITGVREVISVPGNLAGESETQIFLETRTGDPAALTILRRPGMAPAWGVSWTDIVDQSARPPQAETLEWYALACFLPDELPPEAFLQRDRESRDRARADYTLVLSQLGICARSN